MATEVVKHRNGSFPLVDPLNAIHRLDQLVPKVRELAESLYANYKIARATIVWADTEYALEWETARIYRQDVIPVLSEARAHNRGLVNLRSSNLDADLLEGATEELRRRRQRRGFDWR
jgi:hypothetical protein